MKKTVWLAIAAMALMACQESLEEKAAQEARQYTRKNCPAKMDDNLTIDSLAFEAETRTLHYYYTITGKADSVGLLNAETARQALLSELKNTTSMMAYKEAGYRFAYTYHSQKNPSTILFQAVFSPKDYQ